MTITTSSGLLLALSLTFLVACSRGESSDDVLVGGPSISAAPATRSLSAGTSVVVALTDALSSRDAQAGDAVTARLVADAKDAEGSVVIPIGSLIHGTIAEVSAASNIRSTGTLTLAFGTVTVEGRTFLLDASIDSPERVGAAVVAVIKDADVVLPAGSLMTLTLKQRLTLSARKES